MGSLSPFRSRRSCLLPMGLAAAALLVWAASAWGQTTSAKTAQMQVQAEVVDGCSIGSFTSGQAGQIATLNFGTASGLEVGRRTASTAASQVATIRCTIGTNLTLQFDAGQFPSGGVRRMQLGGGTAHLPYRLCRDAACNFPIAPNGSLTRTISAAESQDVRLDIYGDLQLTGNHAAGTYTDIVTIIFSW